MRIMRSRRENESEPGPLQPAPRHIISQPLPMASQRPGTRSMTHTHTYTYIHTYTCAHISAASYSCSTAVSHREVNGEGVHLPPLFLLLNFIHHAQHSVFFLSFTLCPLLYIILHLPRCVSVMLSRSLIVAPLSLQFIMTSICLPPNLLKLLKHNFVKIKYGRLHTKLITSFRCEHAR